MTLRPELEQLLAGESLTQGAAGAAMAAILDGEISDAEIGAFLIALRMRGAGTHEIAAFAEQLLARAIPVPGFESFAVDTCGTGGGPSTWNLSTGAAILAAAARATVAKHGNRAVTSTCGSADVIETLGIRLCQTPAEAEDHLRKVGIAFLFAPAFHPGMKAVGAVRRSLGFRTIFNVLGPMVNPTHLRRQVMGVFEPDMVGAVAGALALRGMTHAVVVHGDDGLDEISPVAPTLGLVVRGSHIESKTFTPREFGIETDLDLDPGATLAENADILQSALSGSDARRSPALIPGAAAALWVSGLVPDLESATELARGTLASGAGLRKLAEWQAASA